jgi:hypothetical protein
MASCILDAVNSVLAQIGAIPFDWAAVQGAEKSREANLFQLVRVWNNQVAREAAGEGYTFEKPAGFLEMQMPEAQQLLENVTISEVIWRLHLVDVELDAGDDTGMDQNLSVFGYRDQAKQTMVGFQPTNCSTLFFTGETQDYDHTGVYHYILEFKSSFTDTKGSRLDPDQTKEIYTGPPTNAELNIQFNAETPALTLEIIPT